MAGARRAAAAAVAVLAAAAVLVPAVGADGSGDSLADLGGAAREIESAPGSTALRRRRSLSAAGLSFAGDRVDRLIERVRSSAPIRSSGGGCGLFFLLRCWWWYYCCFIKERALF